MQANISGEKVKKWWKIVVSFKLHKNGKQNTHPEYKPLFRYHLVRVLSQYYSRKYVGTV